ncbi:hypothetical protein GQR58_015853 [Nymphon striatum]|nr:hypothetical protein GQR58_015853 [Nymphon striatum]
MPTGCCVPICKNRSGHSFPLSNPARSENAIFSVSCGNSSKMPKVQNMQADFREKILRPSDRTLNGVDLSNKIMSSVRFISHFIVHFLHIFSPMASTHLLFGFPPFSSCLSVISGPPIVCSTDQVSSPVTLAKLFTDWVKSLHPVCVLTSSHNY